MRGEFEGSLTALARARTFFSRKGDRRMEALACLKQHASEVSPGCRNALEAVKGPGTATPAASAAPAANAAPPARAATTASFFNGEFDSGSERTLAAWIRHASRTLIRV